MSREDIDQLIMEQEEDFLPKDLSMKCIKRLKPIPPPLNLGENSSALKEFAIIATSPKSPLMQKNLPFRKRAHSLSGTNDIRTQPYASVQSPASTSNTKIQNFPVSPVIEMSNTNSNGIPQASGVIKTALHDGSHRPTCPTISVNEKEVIATPLSESYSVIQFHNSASHSPSWTSTIGQVKPSTVSSVLLSPVGSSREELSGFTHHLAHPWPAPVWHCFQTGTLIKMDASSSGNGTAGVFRLAEELNPSDWVGALQVEQVKEDPSTSQVCIHFCCLGTEVFLTAQCHSAHTFFVRDKGWCAVYPQEIAVRYQVLCQPLERGDICDPPETLSPDVCDRFKRFSFPPEEITVPAPFILSPPLSPCKKPSDSDRPKRPMNAFMLFAKRYRLELIQMHPGKDNRAISVILGEAWRKLPPADKEEYVLEARAMAQEQKRLYPDCWKRKRSHSTS